MSFKPNGMVALLTDFGTRDAYVAVVKARMLQVAPTLRFLDISHAIEPQNIAQGGFILADALPWFPEGTVFLAVVDPGVGSNRKSICLWDGTRALVAPDNGLLTLAAGKLLTHKVVELDPKRVPGVDRISHTFHGRDLFAPAAAALAAGLVKPEELGPALGTIQKAQTMNCRPGEAMVLHIDHFGNIITSLWPENLDEDLLALQIHDFHISERVEYYAQASPGRLVFLEGASGFLEISVVGGSAQERVRAKLGDCVRCITSESTRH
jgi:S-adenosylmethionine hydrolase